MGWCSPIFFLVQLFGEISFQKYVTEFTVYIQAFGKLCVRNRRIEIKDIVDNVPSCYFELVPFDLVCASKVLLNVTDKL